MQIICELHNAGIVSWTRLARGSVAVQHVIVRSCGDACAEMLNGRLKVARRESGISLRLQVGDVTSIK